MILAPSPEKLRNSPFKPYVSSANSDRFYFLTEFDKSAYIHRLENTYDPDGIKYWEKDSKDKTKHQNEYSDLDHILGK
jgi:hypothetical protein